MTVDELRSRYVARFGLEPTAVGVLKQIEDKLGITLPSDFCGISNFYSGGMIGGVSHHTIASGGPATDVTTETLRLRNTIGLPHSMLVLAEPPESLIVLMTDAVKGKPAVIWIDSFDASRLTKLDSLHNPQVWPSYADLIEFLLDRETDEAG